MHWLQATKFLASVNLVQYIQQVSRQFEQSELCFAHGTDNAMDESVYLIYGFLGIAFENEPNSIDRELDEQEIEQLDFLVGRRIRDREPVAYLLEEAWFCGLPFFSDRRALIPRSPIAELIHDRFVGLLKTEPANILDLCTGSGCIGIAAALAFEKADVDLLDVDEDCLELAQKNIDRHGTSVRTKTLCSDLFSQVEKQYDLIIANPPYVSAGEIAELPEEFLHEPRLGLLSAEEGLDIPIRILQQAAAYLRPQGSLVMEVGFSADRLSQRLDRVPLLWLEFEHGGEGVLAITREELQQYREHIN